MIDFLDAVADSGGPLLLIVAAVILVAESGWLVGVVLPGSSTVLLVGVVVGIRQLPVGPTILALALATSAGAQISFIRRRRSGNRFGGNRCVVGARTWAQSQFERGPVVGSAVAQLFGGARTVAPWLAAASPMSYRSFAIANACAALGWVTILVLTGRFAGEDPAIVAPLFACATLLLFGAWSARRVRGSAVVGRRGPGQSWTSPVVTAPRRE